MKTTNILTLDSSYIEDLSDSYAANIIGGAFSWNLVYDSNTSSGSTQRKSATLDVRTGLRRLEITNTGGTAGMADNDFTVQFFRNEGGNRVRVGDPQRIRFGQGLDQVLVRDFVNLRGADEVDIIQGGEIAGGVTHSECLANSFCRSVHLGMF